MTTEEIKALREKAVTSIAHLKKTPGRNRTINTDTLLILSRETKRLCDLLLKDRGVAE